MLNLGAEVYIGSQAYHEVILDIFLQLVLIYIDILVDGVVALSIGGIDLTKSNLSVTAVRS